MRGGQITLFFIVGVVLLFTVAIFYLFAARRAPAQTVDTTNPQLNAYLGSCIDTAVENEFLDIGEHAGVPASVRSSFHANGEGYIFGIMRKQNGPIGPPAHDPPEYPSWNVGIANTEFNDDGTTPLYNYQDGYFGTVQFLAPCSRASANAPLSPLSCKYYPGMPPGTPTEKSTQELAEARLATKAGGCVDTALFRRTLGAEVSVATPVVNLTFTPQVVLASVIFPLTVNDQGHELHLERTYPLRYRAVSEFAFELARKETRDVQFAIDDPAAYKRLASYREGMSVKRLPGDGADRIIINDTASRVHNQPYAFEFLVAHRAPMIDPAMTGCEQALWADPDGMALECGKVNGDLFVRKVAEPQFADCLRPGTRDQISCQ